VATGIALIALGIFVIFQARRRFLAGGTHPSPYRPTAALVVIGDLVALVYNFMGGDLTARFVLKVGAILVVAGAVFGYYRY